jgi:hypothetical protein
MNALNRLFTSLFDGIFAGFEWIGPRTALVAVSALFGVLALWLFKLMSWQAGIRATKDRIKGHLIAVRIYQDDLRVVAQSVFKILLRNVQYLALNFGPVLPLALPFAVVAAQSVVRYAYSGVVPVDRERVLLAGQGTLLEIELAPASRDRVQELRVSLPEGVRALSPLVRSPSKGKAWQEIAALEPGQHAIAFELSGARETKLLVAGQVAPRHFQPRRVSARDWWRIHDPVRWPVLWPAEPAFDAGSPFRSVVLASYPERDLGWLPGGETGVLVVVVGASLLFGFLALKPLGVQI